MRRPRISPPDSLEMLLDTMCNTFGGIILIALLIALFARDSRSLEQQTPPGSEHSSLLGQRVEQAEREVARAAALEEELNRRVTDPTRTVLLELVEERDRIRELAETLASELRASASPADAAASLAETVDRIETLASRNLESERRLAEEQSRAAALKGRIDELGRGIQSQSNRLALITARQTQRLRLPRERATTKSHLYLIVRFGKVYPLYSFVDGVPERNTTSLSWIQESETCRRVEPIPNAGIHPQMDAAAFSAMLRAIPADQIYLVFQVFPDSFEAFNQAKVAALAAGFDYTWEPRLDSTPLRLGPGAPPPPPQ